VFGWTPTLTGDNGAAAIHQVHRQSILNHRTPHLSGAPSHRDWRGRQRATSESRVAPSHTDLRPARTFQARDTCHSGRVARRLMSRGRCGFWSQT
jgi:hypothetical protein